MRSKKFLLSILATVLLLCSSCGLSDGSSSDVSSEEDEVLLSVVDVVGRTADEAEKLLEDAGFTNISIEAAEDSDSKFIINKKNWTVTEQDPSAPFEIASDEEIILKSRRRSRPRNQRRSPRKNRRSLLQNRRLSRRQRLQLSRRQRPRLSPRQRLRQRHITGRPALILIMCSTQIQRRCTDRTALG